MKRTILIAVLILSAVTGAFGQRSSPVDLVLLLDTSSGMSSSYENVNNYITGSFLTEFLRVGDTFHLVPFSSSPRLDVARRINGVGDVETIIGRMLLQYPVENANNIGAAITYAEQYITTLPSRPKKIVLVTIGGSDTSNLVNASKQRLGSRATLDYVQVTPGRALSNLPSSGRPAPARTTAAPAASGTAGTRSTTASPTGAASGASGGSTTASGDTRTGSGTTSSGAGATGAATTGAGATSSSGAGATSSSGSGAPAASGTPTGTGSSTTSPTGTASGGTATGAGSAAATSSGTATGSGTPAGAPAGSGTTGTAATSGSGAAGTTTATSSTGTASGGTTGTVQSTDARTTADTVSDNTAGEDRLSSNLNEQQQKEKKSISSSLPLIIAIIIGVLLLLGLVILLASRRLSSSPNRVMRDVSSSSSSGGGAFKDHSKDLASYAAGSSARRTTPYDDSKKKTENVKQPVINPSGPLLLNLFVGDQNTSIGRRNIHSLKSGYSLSVGGGKADDYLIFLVPMPPALGEIRREGATLTFIPKKPKYFPDIGSNQVKDCINKTIRVVSDKNYEMHFRFEMYEDPLIALNRTLMSVKVPG